MSPLAMIGIRASALTARMVSYSACPVYCWQARAAVDGQCANASRFGDFQDAEGVPVVHVPTGAIFSVTGVSGMA